MYLYCRGLSRYNLGPRLERVDVFKLWGGACSTFFPGRNSARDLSELTHFKCGVGPDVFWSGWWGLQHMLAAKIVSQVFDPEEPVPETPPPIPETRNLKPETRRSRFETRNPKPDTQVTKPETRNPTLETRNPKPCTAYSTLKPRTLIPCIL